MSDEMLRIVSDLAAEVRALRRERDDLKREVLKLRGWPGESAMTPPPLPSRFSLPGGGSTKLSERQARVLAIIGESIGSRGFPPTLREIGKLMGIGSTNGVNDHFVRLERKGFIVRYPGALSRGIGLTEEGRRMVEEMRKS